MSSFEPQRLSYDELVAVLAQRDAQVAELEAKLVSAQARFAALEELVAELMARLGRDSSNSSKPPGSDGPGSRAERRAKDKQRRAESKAKGLGAARTRGGQVGHVGDGLRPRPPGEVDQFVALEPSSCRRCGDDLAGAELADRQIVQVIDLPEQVKALVTQYELAVRVCGCGARTCAPLPPGVPGAPVAYGPNLAAAALTLHQRGQLSMERTVELVEALYGIEVSEGWINKLLIRLDGRLGGFEDDLKAALLAQRVLISDETPAFAVEDAPETKEQIGRAFHPHVFTLRSTCLIWLGASFTRGHAGFDSFDLLGRFTGTLVSDDYGAYAKFEPLLAARGLCNAHLIRDLTGIAESEPERQGWAGEMLEVLRSARAAVRDAQQAGLDAVPGERLEEIKDAYRGAAARGIAANDGRLTSDRKKKHPALVLAERLTRKIDQVLRHLEDFAVPWTSNLAEQALRHVKIHLKISGCFRTLTTLRRYCRIQSYIATARLHGQRTLDVIHAALCGKTWTPLTPA